MNAPRMVIVDGVRTPFSKMGTDLARLGAEELGRIAVSSLLTKTGLNPALIDEVIFGCVGQPADAANVARVIALRAGIPEHVPAFTVHRNCASGCEAFTQAYEKMLAGRGEIFVVGGAESMSQVPLLYTHQAAAKFAKLSRARSFGQKLGAMLSFRPSDFRPRIGLQLGLTDPVCGMNMGETAEVLAREHGITREKQDAFALESHQRAIAAREKLEQEICPIYPPNTKAVVTNDNGPRKEQTMEALAKLKPVFDRKNGTVTAGNASQITDGAVALLVMSEMKAAELGLTPLGSNDRLRLCRMRSATDGPGSGVRDRGSRAPHGHHARPRGHCGDQRSVRGAGHRLPRVPEVGRVRAETSQAGSPCGQDPEGGVERERRRHRPRTSGGCHRCAIDSHQLEGTATPGCQTRSHLALRWWRTRRSHLVGKELNYDNDPDTRSEVGDGDDSGVEGVNTTLMETPELIRRHVTDENICVLTFDRPDSAANIFDKAALMELSDHINYVMCNSHIKGLVLTSAKKSIFIAGADLTQLSKAKTPDELRDMIELGQVVFNRLATLNIPTVAAIHGACVGGGYEVTLACDYRIASPDKVTKIGLPETQLGIIPAWGGSTRLPRLIGLPKALDVILGGKTLAAKPALKCGMVDDLVPREYLVEKACQLILKRGMKLRVRKTKLAHKLTTLGPVVNMITKKVGKQVFAKTRGHYPAIPKALEVVTKGLSKSLDDSLALERDAILELGTTEACKNLIRIFFLQERAKKLTGVPADAAPETKVALL
jgi:acetyl-CoA acetyltransferase family protein